MPPSSPIPDAESLLAVLAERMRPAVEFDAAFVGIYSGGAWIADRLAKMIPGEHPVGYIDVSFYRDDFARSGLKSGTKRRAAVRRRGSDDRPGRRRPLHRTQRARGGQRTFRLWAPGRILSPCWPTAAAANCRSRPRTAAPGSRWRAACRSRWQRTASTSVRHRKRHGGLTSCATHSSMTTASSRTCSRSRACPRRSGRSSTRPRRS